MKAAIVPEVHGTWTIKEIPTPEPGPGEVLIRIQASGLCYTDVHISEGHIPAQFPRTLGHEPVGAVVGVGGLGHLALQYAKAAGFETIAVTHSKDKEQSLRELGADHVVADGASLAKVGGADVILATGNSFPAVTDSIQALRPDGRVVLMGVGGQAITIPTSILWVRGRVLGSSQNDPDHLYEALDWVAKGKV